MKRNSLFAVIAMALGGVATVQAQDFDDRYYFAANLFGMHNDNGRNTDSTSVMGQIAIGRFINPHASIDVFVDHTTRQFNDELKGTGNFNNHGLGADLRWYFGDNGWRPFIVGGLGANRHSASGAETGWAPMFEIGVGVQKAMTENVNFRAQLIYREDFDNDTKKALSPFVNKDHYGDVLLGIGVTIAIGNPGSAPITPVASTPAAAAAVRSAPNCRELDDDKDGVNNCDDKCPGSASGSIVGPDGCPQTVMIDLRGVNFKFDRPRTGEGKIEPTLKEPTSESLAILEQAVDTLKRYPSIRVEVDGHTDSVGSDEYNQRLSDRRAQVVYDYLTGHGISASRLDGPKGFGESKPIDTNDTAEGRQRNRRTELQVENK